MKKVIKIFIVLVLFTAFNVNAADSGNDIYEYNQFIKKDDKGHEILDAEFTQVTIRGKVMQESIKNGSPSVGGTKSAVPKVGDVESTGKYKYIYEVQGTEEVYDLLTPEQYTLFEGMQTLEDYERVKDILSYVADENAYCAGKDSYVNHLKDSKGITVEEEEDGPKAEILFNGKSNNVVRLAGSVDARPAKLHFTALSYTFIEEVKTPQGLEKTNIIVPMRITLTYTVNADDTLTLTSGYAIQERNLLKYNSLVDFSDVSDVFAKVDDSFVFEVDSECPSEYAKWYDYSCNNEPILHPAINPISTPQGNVCTSTVIDKTSTEDLSKKVEIESFVNGKKEVNVQKSEEVTITVKVYNGSKTPLYTNKVVSKVPADFTLVNDSILKNGTYDENTRTVTWNYDYLDSMKAEIFSYKVKAPDTISNGASVKTSATLTSYGSEVPIVSDEATMDLGDQTNNASNDDVVNPKTGSITEQLVITILTISIGATLLIARKTRIKTM